MANVLTRSAKSMVLAVARRSRLVRNVADFIAKSVGTSARDTYPYLKERFIRIGEHSTYDCATRSRIIERFEVIDREVPIGTTPTDGLVLAQALLSTQAHGDVVECGCYAGGSTAKLSILASLLGRELVVFDSFEGLPQVDHDNLADYHARRSSGWVTDWTAGRYAARLDDVQSNVRKYGDISVCTFVKGWFRESLTDEALPRAICFAFTDVDIASSARDCLVSIWPRLSDMGVFVSHDAAYIKVLQALHDEDLWRNVFKCFPPIFFGAGFGIYDSSPHIGYFIKGGNVSPEYIKSLTLDQ